MAKTAPNNEPQEAQRAPDAERQGAHRVPNACKLGAHRPPMPWLGGPTSELEVRPSL
jgi:hypothetical protein